MVGCGARLGAAPTLTGIPSVCVQWGAWRGIGMVATSAAVHMRMRRVGIAALSPSAGLSALQDALGLDATPQARTRCLHAEAQHP